MELHYLKNNRKIIDDKISELYETIHQNINIINRELASHDINKRYTNIMIYFQYKMNEIQNVYKRYGMNALDTVTYYTLITQLLRIAQTAFKYMDRFTNICNIKFGQTSYNYNKIKYQLLSKLLDKYQSYGKVIKEFDVLENVAHSAYDFLDFETDFKEDYSDITISFTCGMIRDELEGLQLSDQIEEIDEIEDILMKRFKNQKKKQLTK